MSRMFLFVVFCVSEYIEVTESNAGSVIGGPRHALVKFIMPGCIYCQRMEDAFVEAAKSQSDALYGSVNCAKEGKMCSRFSVRGYPTVLFFKRGSKEGSEYMGDRSSKSFKNFVKLKLQDDTNGARPVVQPKSENRKGRKRRAPRNYIVPD